MTDLFDAFRESFEHAREERMDLEDYLDLCKKDPMAYATAAERMVKAIGDPVKVDTSADPRLSRIFLNRTVRTYPAFRDFFGMEDTIERVVGYFKHAAQGLEERKQVLYLLGPVGGGKCHPAGTKIAMADGTWKPIDHVQIGDMVVAIDPNTRKRNAKRVLNTFRLGTKPTKKLTTGRGLELSSAPTHRLLTQRGWTRMDEIRDDDFIATARDLPFGNETDDPAFLRVLAYVLGDGHIPAAANITFSNFNDTIIADFKEAVASLGCNVTVQNDLDGNLACLRITERAAGLPIRKRFGELGLLGAKSHDKFIPPFVFTLAEGQLSLFLSRLYATDGWASVGERKTEIGYCSVSRRMATEVQRLLAKFGIASALRRKTTSHGVAYTVIVSERENVLTFLARIGIFGKERACDEVFAHLIDQRRLSGGGDRVPKSLVREVADDIPASKKDGSSRIKDQLRTTLCDNAGVRLGYLRYAAEMLDSDALRDMAYDHVYWDTVATITDEQPEPMFDIEVDGLHNYVAEGVVSHNSSISERLKELMETFPIYVLATDTEHSPVFESPLGLFPASKYGDIMQKRYGIDRRYLTQIMSPWAIKRLKEFDGDVRKFKVVRLMPSKLEQIAVVKTEPGDENNQDISTLVGKTDIRKLEQFSQSDPDAYAFSGALCRGNQGIMEFVRCSRHRSSACILS